MMNKKGAGNAMGVIGIVSIILLFNGLVIFYFGAIGQDIQTKEFAYGNGNCDCGTLTCTEYAFIYGDDAMQTLCSTQSNDNLVTNIITGAGSLPILSTLVIVMNIALVIAVVVIARGGSG